MDSRQINPASVTMVTLSERGCPHTNYAISKKDEH